MSATSEMALEGLAHLDPELQWVATESAETFTRVALRTNQAVSVHRMAKSYCPAVAQAVAERLGAKAASAQLTADEAATLGADALQRLDPDFQLGFHDRVTVAARVVAAAAKLRFLSPKVVVAPGMDYWPFGQDGGFCNPRKLTDC